MEEIMIVEVMIMMEVIGIYLYYKERESKKDNDGIKACCAKHVSVEMKATHVLNTQTVR